MRRLGKLRNSLWVPSGGTGSPALLRWRARCARAGAILLCGAIAALAFLIERGDAEPAAPNLLPTSGPWKGGKFNFASSEKKTRKSLSGIACATRNVAGQTCLVVFDEGVEARYITLSADGYRVDNEAVVLEQSSQ